MEKNDTLIARVTLMEERYNRVSQSMAEPGDLEALREYMDSGQWKEDFEADEAGMIPPEVPRGVLSEDGLYNLLEDSEFYVSEIITTPPQTYSSELQEKVYEAFSTLGIPFDRVETDPGITMEDCRHIDDRIGVRIVKTVFLCNRQQTEFYLYVTTDDKPFVTREFCGALGIPRVSFAPADKLWELTGVLVGATTILSSILPSASRVHLVMDRTVAAGEWFACTDGTATCFVKIRTKDLLYKYIPASGQTITLI